jgi:hypothetical protein
VKRCAKDPFGLYCSGLLPLAVECLRELEGLMADVIAIRSWMPDGMRLEILRLLSGSEGELIGAAVTMLSRLALNVLRN